MLDPSLPECPENRVRYTRVYIARRAKPSVVPGHVKLTFTLDMPRELAERLSARAIREGVNLEAAIVETLREGKE